MLPKHTHHWNRLRKRLQSFSLLLLIFILLLVVSIDRLIKDYTEAVGRLNEIQSKVEVKTVELIAAKKQVEQHSNKIIALAETIRRQNNDIQWIESKLKVSQERSYNNELAKEIQSYIVKNNPYQTIVNCNQRDIFNFIYFAKKYEKIYKQKYKIFESCYSWKVVVKILYIESTFVRDPKLGKASERGCPQILEYEMCKGRPQYLYPMLIKLGYKKNTYNETIDFYRNSVECQVNCLYEELTRKLKWTNGDFIKAIVAYNSFRPIPEQSAYWLRYQKAGIVFNGWLEEVEKRVGRLE